MPAYFYLQALCVHDGWHYKIGKPWNPATYIFGRVRLRRTWKTWSNGEGAWNNAGGLYGGGLQFTLGTWHRAGGYARSTYDIARATPREQIYRAWRIVHLQDGDSWREWPNTSRGCGLD